VTNDALLDILKWALLALLYLFFARVLFTVWTELRAPRTAAGPTVTSSPDDPTMVAAAPAATAPLTQPTTTKHAKVRTKRGKITALVVLEPKSQKGRAFPLDREITVGRATTCTIALPDDPYISTLHAHVVRDGDEVWVDDLGSTNGSHLNGARLTTRMLVQQGDRLQFGQTLLEAQ
jgi:pSer/pThr/pTyr-binding forkhead associated (FHA) protein